MIIGIYLVFVSWSLFYRWGYGLRGAGDLDKETYQRFDIPSDDKGEKKDSGNQELAGNQPGESNRDDALNNSKLQRTVEEFPHPGVEFVQA